MKSSSYSKDSKNGNVANFSCFLEVFYADDMHSTGNGRTNSSKHSALVALTAVHRRLVMVRVRVVLSFLIPPYCSRR
jgi:hypothetical protein